MSSNNATTTCTADYWDNIARLKQAVKEADAIVIGAGAGLSAAAGLQYGGERFARLFLNFIAHYGLTDMYSSAFYPFETQEAYWAYFAKHIYHNRYESEVNGCYSDLLRLVQGVPNENYFVITTNADHLFIKSGFDKQKLCYTQGDYGLLQCSVPCHAQTYDNKELVYKMVAQQKNFKIPTELLPKCPRCGAPMEVNLRKDDTFVEDAGWHAAVERYETFLKENIRKKILFLELGVGYNTPSIIKYPFWQMTHRSASATYACINLDDASCPKEIEKKAIGIEGDIYAVLRDGLY